MVVGYQYGIHVVICKSILGKFLLQSPQADSGIYHYSCSAVLSVDVEEIAVAATAAGKGLEHYLVANHFLYSISRSPRKHP